MVMWIVVFISSFVSVGFMVMQTRNVVQLNYKSIFFNSVMIDVTRMIPVVYVVTDGWDTLPPLALGGALGSVVFTWAHKKFYK